MNDNNGISVDQLAALAHRRGRSYWKGLEELAGTAEFQARLADEFPAAAAEWPSGFSRRRFLQVMGASLALTGITGCVKAPNEKIVPYVQQPEQLTPGKPLFYSTAFTLGGYARGIVVEQHEGRPTKIEGNPDHPASLGATDAITQASILGLYDPDRSKVVSCYNAVSTWGRFVDVMAEEMQAKRDQKGKGLVLLTETVTSPTLAAQIRALLASMPLASWHQFDAVGRDNIRRGATLAFGSARNVLYDFTKASVIVALESNFLIDDPGSVRYARDFFNARRVRPDVTGPRTMNRLYVAEGTPSTTGSMADYRIPVAGGDIAAIAAALALKLGIPGIDAATTPKNAGPWLDNAARDLKAAGTGALVIVGESQPPEIHALAHAINAALKSAAALTTDPVEAQPVIGLDSMRELVGKMHAGAVDTIIIFGGNPGYAAPLDFDFPGGMDKVRLRIRVGLYEDETSHLCHWQIPQSHPLEAWSDARAYDGTISIVQPLIAPLYNSKSDHEMLSVLAGNAERGGHEIVRAYWNDQHPGDFESFWQTALEKGIIANSALGTSAITSAVTPPNLMAASTRPSGNSASIATLSFRPDPCVWDGAFSNNGWLQELPKPLTKLTWDNAALISPALAGQLGVWNNDLVAVTVNNKTVNLPVWVLPGQPENSVTVHLGYGRRRAGSVGNNIGVDVYPLRASSGLWYAPIDKIEKIDGSYKLAATHTHQTMADRALPGVPADVTPEVVKKPTKSESPERELSNRNLIRTATLDQFNANPHVIRDMEEKSTRLSIYQDEFAGVYAQNLQWGMSIDLTSCMGCNACVVACQAENNIPVVGKEQVLAGREMHWIRIDTYYTGELDNPEAYHQPVPCMHCENAPCEVVCPVEATVHDNEGTNNMVYNRCVGTRYCQNNCPYKVRRFNFLQYSDGRDTIMMQKNPSVTVRSRGVMEKCTYCIQRITSTRLDIEKTQVRLEAAGAAHNDVVAQMQAVLDSLQTACQQACPTQAIVFGNINPDKEPQAGNKSKVVKLKELPVDYGILTDLNTKPRTTYMARLRNPPSITPAPEKSA